MKIRGSVFWLIVAAALVVLTLFWFEKRQSRNSRLADAPRPLTEGAETTNNLVMANQIAHAPKNLTSAYSQSTNTEHKSKMQEMLTGLSTQNDVPIMFYGKVEDQFGNAISGTAINFGVRVYNGTESTVKTGRLTSDAAGLFTISGYTGESLGLGAEKSGYVFVSMNGSGIYSHLYPEDQRAHSDQDNPTVIKMWKLQGGQALTHFTFSSRVPCDGKPVLFDFLTGKVVEAGGDLMISLECPPKPDTSREYDWKAIVQPVDGGIVVADSSLQLMFQAPDTGYDPNIKIKNVANIKPWASTFHGGFYFNNHNGGCYGKFDLGIVVYATKDGLVPITIEGYINPAGSKNLEIDPAKIMEASP